MLKAAAVYIRTLEGDTQYAVLFWFSFSLGASDFDRVEADVSFENSADEMNLAVRTRNDDITLEYNDIIILEFTPDDPSLIEFLEEDGQYIRD